MGEPSWEAVDREAGLFALERTLDNGWCFRTTALTLPRGGTLVVSPTRGTVQRAAPWLEERGGVRFVLAPCYFHYLGIPELLERFPDARVVASEAAAPRVRRKLGELGVEVAGLDALHDALPPHARILQPPALKTGEVWLRVVCEHGVAWVVTDAFFHVNNELRGAWGLALKVTGTAPGLRIGGTFKVLAVGDRRRYRDWVEHELETDPPRLLVPAHGDVIDDRRLGERLHRLVRARL